MCVYGGLHPPTQRPDWKGSPQGKAPNHTMHPSMHCKMALLSSNNCSYHTTQWGERIVPLGCRQEEEEDVEEYEELEGGSKQS